MNRAKSKRGRRGNYGVTRKRRRRMKRNRKTPREGGRGKMTNREIKDLREGRRREGGGRRDEEGE